MQRFRFRLQALLRLRSQFERTARRELAGAMATVASVEQRLSNAAQGLRDCQEQVRGRSTGAPLALALEAALRRHQWRLQQESRRANAALDTARTDYLGRRQELRVLQQLREQRWQAWQKAAQAAEQAELDELAQLRRVSPGPAGNPPGPVGVAMEVDA